MRILHGFLDNIGLKDLHKNKSIGSQFANPSSKVTITNKNNFYLEPEIPIVELKEESIKGSYGIGKFSFKSEINNNVSNKYASGMYFLNKEKPNNNVNCIIVHGWRMTNLEPIYKMFTDNLINEGYNIYYYTLPYHFEREPKESMFNGELMVGANIDRTLLSVRQVVSDLRALISWLKNKNRGKVVLIGVSLGGLMTNLVGVVDNKIDGLISIIYANSLAYSVFKTIPGKYIKMDYENNNFTYDKLKYYWEIITPSNFKPIINKDKILLVSGIYDKYVHIEDTDSLWESWEKPKRLRLKCGHSGLITKRKLIYKEVVSFIKEL